MEIAGANNPEPPSGTPYRGGLRRGDAGRLPRRTMHDRDVPSWTCRHCRATFRTKQSLTVHLLKVHITLGPRERALSVDHARRVGLLPG